MLEPAIPPDEEKRIATLQRLAILDTPPEERFDRLTRLTQNFLGVPVAVVSLVDSTRQWFKSCQGLSATETPRSISFCGHAILDDQIFIVPDASLDPRFADNPLVTEAPYIRFYAGQPLKASNGCRLGTLCVIDSKPRQLTQTECDSLRDMAALVENELNLLNNKGIEDALQSSKNSLAAILDNVLDGIITINEQGIVESFNKAAERIFGYSADEVTGQNVKMLMPEPYHSEHDGYLHNHVSTGKKKIIGIGRQVVGRRRDGSTFPMDLAVSAMQLGDKRMFTGIVRDITERVRTERMKSEFISTVSHELRTPLTAIRGSLGLVAGGVAGELPVQARALIDIAHKNSERLILLVNDILDTEKIEAGKMEFIPAAMRLTPLLHQAIEANHAYAEQFRVHYQLDDALPDVQVFVDINRFQQVLSNLLSNAAKFSPAGDTVNITVESDERRVRVNISDHGSGISEQFRSQIFKKFSQADSSDTRKKGGTGLGLSISKAIVEQMGGGIGFESQPDVLTTFWVELPVWEAAAYADSNEPTGTKRILVCEDDQAVASLLQNVLEQAGFETDIASDAMQARQMLLGNDYSAMTLDLAMLGKRGAEFMHALRADKKTAALPVLVVSARAVEGHSELLSDAFCIFDWMEMPIDPARLLVALKQAMIRSSSTRPRILHIEDDLDVCHVVNAIAGELAEIDCAHTVNTARQKLRTERYDLAILDISLPDGSGIELLHALNSAIPPVPVMVFSAHEIGQDILGRVNASLVKSRTDNAHLLETVRRMVNLK